MRRGLHPNCVVEEIRLPDFAINCSETEVLKRLTKHWAELVDYWDVDFDYMSRREIIRVDSPNPLEQEASQTGDKRHITSSRPTSIQSSHSAFSNRSRRFMADLRGLWAHLHSLQTGKWPDCSRIIVLAIKAQWNRVLNSNSACGCQVVTETKVAALASIARRHP